MTRLTRRSAVFGIVSATALGSFGLPTAAQARQSKWPDVGFDRLWISNRVAERVQIIFWDGQAYDPSAVQALSWFWRDTKDHDAAVYVDPRLFTYLANVQTMLSLMADQPLSTVLTSGFRTVRRNATIEGAAPNSFHCRGKAADVGIATCTPHDVHRVADALGVPGLGYYPPTSRRRGFVHLDVGPAGRRWNG